MKILSIKEFTTTEGTAKTTELELDTRPGVYFKVITGTFETPFFTLNQESVPVMMLHADREQKNVSLIIEDSTLKLEQGYRLASHGYLISQVNDDWADVSELQTVTVDAMEIEKVNLTNGKTVVVTSNISGLGVLIRSTDFAPSVSEYTAQFITTNDGRKYIYPIKLTSHLYSTDPDRYDYITAQMPRAITAFIKPQMR